MPCLILEANFINIAIQKKLMHLLVPGHAVADRGLWSDLDHVLTTDINDKKNIRLISARSALALDNSLLGYTCLSVTSYLIQFSCRFNKFIVWLRYVVFGSVLNCIRYDLAPTLLHSDCL